MPKSFHVLVASLLATTPVAAQQRAAAQPGFKGILEPVSFSESINFSEVFFVTDDKGGVAGENGTIIHTSDGGATWTAQLGGDPEAPEDPVKMLRFVDDTHGWAVRDGRILRTEDGENWEDLGAAPDYIHELAMATPTEGVSAGYVGSGTQPTAYSRPGMGAAPGRRWRSAPSRQWLGDLIATSSARSSGSSS